jgi:hypothetical protein
LQHGRAPSSRRADTKAPVSGTGVDAFAESAGPLNTLYVKKGSVTFMVRVYGVADPARQLAIEKPLAQSVASHP